MAVTVTFVSINVNNLNREGTVAVGEVNQAGWSAHGKNNFGNGFYIGNTLAFANVQSIVDVDLIDSPINDSDNLPSAQNQAV
ncbi:MAG TPA: hypothetical protein VF260_12150 [Bacilli bacterium]